MWKEIGPSFIKSDFISNQRSNPKDTNSLLLDGANVKYTK